MGDMADYINSSWPDYWTEGDEPNPQPYRTCKYCGQTCLVWHKLESGNYRIMEEDGRVHTCKYNR